MKENKFLNSTLFKLIVAITIFFSILIIGSSLSNYFTEKKREEIDKFSMTTRACLIKTWTNRTGDYGEFEYIVNGKTYSFEDGIEEWVHLGDCYELIYNRLKPKNCYIRWTSPLLSDFDKMQCTSGVVTEVNNNPKPHIPVYGKRDWGYINFKFKVDGVDYEEKQLITKDSLAKSNIKLNDSFLVCFPKLYPETAVLQPHMRIDR